MGKVSFLGVEGSGKTVLTMALVNAFKELEKDGWFLRPDSRESYRFLMQQSEKIKSGELPGQTSSLHRMVWSLMWKNQVIRQIDVLDYPGELYRLAFLDSSDDLQPEEFKEKVSANKKEIDELLGNLLDSDIVFVLFNLDDARNQMNNSHNLDSVWVTNSCLDYLYQIPNHPSIIFLLTQIDRYEDLFSGGVENLMSRYLPLISNNFPNLIVSPVSALSPNMRSNGIADVIQFMLPEGIEITEDETDLIESEDLGSDYQKNTDNKIMSGKQRFAKVQYSSGLRYYWGKEVAQDYQEAARLFHEAAKNGLADAQFVLGICYENGWGVQKNSKEAVKWYLLAAEQGHAKAQFNLGVCFLFGEGIKQDDSSAVEWFTLSAEQEFSDAQYNLGWCYENGRGVQVDYSQMVKWYSKAAAQGNEDAKKALDSFKYEL